MTGSDAIGGLEELCNEKLRKALAEAWEEGKDAGLNGGWDNPYAPKDPS